MMSGRASASAFPVAVTSPDKVIWEGKGISVSAENSTGRFDILPEHANFVTIIKPGVSIVVRTAEGSEHTFAYKNVVLAVKDGRVGIYVNI
jgi:F0F1-type ATP synthase epsilon subunit